MEFDINKVYTAVNADELKIGSKCIFADDLNRLRKKVQQVEQYTSELIGIREDCELYRFRGPSDEQDEGHALAYFIDAPKEPQYKPFSTLEKAKEIISKHGGWVFERDSSSFLITGYDIVKPSGCLVYVGNTARSLQYLFEHFILDDGSPCGELVEEGETKDEKGKD